MISMITNKKRLLKVQIRLLKNDRHNDNFCDKI